MFLKLEKDIFFQTNVMEIIYEWKIQDKKLDFYSSRSRILSEQNDEMVFFSIYFWCSILYYTSNPQR